MIISVPHRFLFISMPKCASVAIESALRPFASIAISGDITHSTLADYETFLEPFLQKRWRVDTASFTIFALFREPSDWLRSWWRYRARAELADPGHRLHRNYTGNITLEDYVSEYVSPNPAPCARVGTQAQLIMGRGGEYERVTLFRYEEIDRFLEHLAERVGRPLRPNHVNVSPPRAGAISAAALSRLRSAKARDFEIYDMIPMRQEFDARPTSSDRAAPDPERAETGADAN